jgi:hypothetical protein
MKNICSFFTVCFLIFVVYSGKAQITDSIVGLNNDPIPNVFFCKIDIATGGITNHQLVSQGLSSNFSTCVNYTTLEYYFCEGNILKTINASTGNVVSIDTLVNSPSVFKCLLYNKCDSNIYGTIYTPSVSGIEFVRYNPASKVITQISVLPVTVSPCWGCKCVFDIDSNYIIIDTGNSLAGVDIISGALKFATLKINVPGENFGHIALNCQTKEILGTSANVNQGRKYLSRIDRYTGQVTHVSNHYWTVGVWKPVGGGNCINQLTGDFIYSGAGGQIISVNSITGALDTNFQVSGNEIYFIDHFSSCNCSTVHPSVSETESLMELEINSFNNELIINSNEHNNHTIKIYDLTSRIIFNSEFSETIQINLLNFSSGLYVYEIRNESGNLQSGKFIMQ